MSNLCLYQTATFSDTLSSCLSQKISSLHINWTHLEEHESLQVAGGDGWVVEEGCHVLRDHHQGAEQRPGLFRQHREEAFEHKRSEEERKIKKNVEFKDMGWSCWTIVSVAKKAKPWYQVAKKEQTEYQRWQGIFFIACFIRSKIHCSQFTSSL